MGRWSIVTYFMAPGFWAALLTVPVTVIALAAVFVVAVLSLTDDEPADG